MPYVVAEGIPWLLYLLVGGGATVGLFVAYQRGGVLPIKSGFWCAAFCVLVRSRGSVAYSLLLIGRRSATVCASAQSSTKSSLETPRRICTPVATAFGGSLRSGDMRLRFGAAFGTICVGETHGTWWSREWWSRPDWALTIL